jgi:ATP synthase protein I
VEQSGGKPDAQGGPGPQHEKAGREKREAEFSRRIKVKAARKVRARRTQDREAQIIWSGLGMIGLVGWGVSVPTLLGAALGIWLDRRFPGEHSWTLTLLFAGLLIGCLNAWRWVTHEERVTRIREGQETGECQERASKPETEAAEGNKGRKQR